MKKVIVLLCLMAAIFCSCKTSAGAPDRGTVYSLKEAIEYSAAKTSLEIPAGSRVVFAVFDSFSADLSNYIMDEITGALINKGFEVADRRNLEYAYRELGIQKPGDISDETARSIGKFLAADIVITGRLTDANNMYRYFLSAIQTEQAAFSSDTALNVRKDSQTQRFIVSLADQNQITAAGEKFGVSEDKTPNTAGTFLDRGIMFAMRGEYSTAIDDFSEVIQLNSNISAAYMLRARALYAMASHVVGVLENFSGVSTVATEGQTSAEQAAVYERAIEDFTRALSLDPDNGRLHTERGRVYADIGYSEKAVADYNQAIHLNPNDANAYGNRGIVYAINGNYDQAIADYDKAISLSPNSWEIYNSRGTTYVHKGDYEKAIADYTKAIQLNPNGVNIYNNRGVVYFYFIKDYNLAAADFETALQLNPNDAGIMRILENIRQLQNR